MIISAQSSPDVLRERGFIAYSRSLGSFIVVPFPPSPLPSVPSSW